MSEKAREHYELEDWAKNGTIDPTYRHLLSWAVAELARLAERVKELEKDNLEWRRLVDELRQQHYDATGVKL